MRKAEALILDEPAAALELASLRGKVWSIDA
jgi:hypothetical protein